MRFEPTSLPLLEQYPELEYYDDLRKQTGLEDDKVLRYMCYFYDEESPFANITDIDIKRTKCAEKAGFKKGKKGFAPEVQQMLDGNNLVANEMAYTFCSIFGSYIFETWLSIKSNLHHINKVLRTPPDLSDSKKSAEEMQKRSLMQKELQGLIQQVMQYEGQIVKGDKVTKKILDMVATTKLRNYPELYAQSDTVV